MKKFTLLAAAAAFAISANAQFVAETPYFDQSVTAGKVSIFDITLGNESVFEALQAHGQTTNDYRLNDSEGGPATICLYIWSSGETFRSVESAYPSVGYDELDMGGGYVNLAVADAFWSGAGFFVKPEANYNTTHWTDDTRFHLALRCPNQNPPETVTLTLLDGDLEGSGKAVFCVGAAAEGNPVVAPQIGDDWFAIDLSLGDVKKLCEGFTYVSSEAWTGNLLAFSAGGVEGKGISLDALYFYTLTDEDVVIADPDDAVHAVANDALFVVTNETVNVAGAESIELYDLAGRLVKKANGSVLGIGELKGAYLVKAGNAVKKIVK
ncbi:MAG: T9SS type A sorting domain-containing protein [Muribaculaceae bacterium]|nr:T9SS type A sorting domain-containing protein [Muribaculaceae bacterium]